LDRLFPGLAGRGPHKNGTAQLSIASPAGLTSASGTTSRNAEPAILPVTIDTSMKCPFCGHEEDKVVDSRESKEGESIRRRRECLKCEKRFTTYERIDEIPYMVVKKDGRREKFERQKVLNGLLRACEKRPVSIGKLEQIVNEAEGFVIDSAERERKTSEVGELIMNRLRNIDKVAYVRFASVYLDFKDVNEFMAELQDLLQTKEAKAALKEPPKITPPTKGKPH
jgi:transcriptional repressor NrdR